MLTNFIKRTTVLFVSILCYVSINAQSTRPYTLVFSQNIKGGTAIFGNTSMHSVTTLSAIDLVQMNESGDPTNSSGGIGFSQYGNDNENMQPALIDNSTPLLINATSADLILPSGSNTIKFARLYWGGRVNNIITLSAADTLRKVKIRKGNTGSYSNILTAAANVDYAVITANESVYQSYVDVTSFIQANGSGSYTVADVPSNAGAIGTGGNYAGWCIMIAYENLAQPLQSLRVYDGFVPVYNAGTSISQTVTLTGLNVPNNPLSFNDAIMSTMVWEGDANLGASATSPEGDYIKINNIAVSNAINPVTNFWNSSISTNGAFVTTKNPNYFNQKGIDIDQLQVGTGYGILPNASNVVIEFGTEADRYFPSIFGFAIRMKEPILILNKSVSDANNNNILETEEILTYTLSGSNIGPGTAFNTTMIDSLPTNVTYIPGSLKINQAPNVLMPTPQTDGLADDFAFKNIFNGRHYVQFYLGTNATFISGGEIADGQSYNVSFKVKAAIIPGSVINIARIVATSQTGDPVTDDGTAIIGPSGGPVAVTMRIFYGKKENSKNVLYWITENEINSDYFNVEASHDGINFYYLGTVKAKEQSSTTTHYRFVDDNNLTNSIQYYRLKIINKNTNTLFSKIVTIANPVDNDYTITTYPNPFTNQINISVTSNISTQTNCLLYTYDGKQVLQRKIYLQKGKNIIVLKDLDHIAKGQYVMEITINNKKARGIISKN